MQLPLPTAWTRPLLTVATEASEVVQVTPELTPWMVSRTSISPTAMVKSVLLSFRSVGAEGVVVWLPVEGASRLLAVVAPDSAPIKRVVQEARDRGMLIDASFGRKTKAVLLMDTDHVILSAITPEAIHDRWNDKNTSYQEDEE